ncbi:MAG: TRAP transporter large permease [Synergistaceae bacterium]|jgi:C4-dicarboxylate transporter DctM subunit|nr:TRAP transporter large permease [Synergistaceae bacterium]
MSGIILFALFFGLLLIVPVGYAIGIATLLSMIFCTSIPLETFTQTSVSGANSFTLMAVPFFMLCGSLMTTGGVAKRIVNFVNTLFGALTGGLAIVTTVACMFFGAISGSAVATTSAIGSFMIPEMRKKGYDDGFSGAVAAAAGSVGVIIPPSVPFVIYGVVVSCSISDLFKAGIIPGILMGVALMIVCYALSKNRGYEGTGHVCTAWEVWASFKDAFFALLMPVIILGGIYSGVFTATEAAVVAVVYCIVVSVFVYREMTWKQVYEAFSSVVEINGVTLFMMGFTVMFASYLTLENIPSSIASFIMSISDNKFIILLIINFFLLLVGCVIDNIPATIIFAPIFLPVVAKLGMSPITFGVMLTMNLAIGFVTPPYGICLFMVSAISEIQMGEMMKNMVGFLIALLVVLALVTYIPFVTMCLL